ncbi:hypothetical protein EXIGLDRAFT_844273 [Exidia glandulosa HHB12029]|uniref:F-box domain-containing protein n=1 Tax=Exidia glandulosa HHB12029 TaxID=1314781 RepID=A0A165ZE32_EXIGL|nr:hypothetical protein EXIGLDRAFT_844273 [Exidia glandulosa HHB12029]
MPLSLSPQGQVDPFVTQLLQCALSDVHSATEVDDFAAILQTAVRVAVANFANAWNRDHSAITIRLPPEVLSKCFAWLEPTERVKATHISRAWRAIALSEPTLWALFKPRNQALHLSEYLTTLLARSGDVPFDLRWYPPSFDCISQHLHRIRSLVLQTGTDDFQKVLESSDSMASLRHLSVAHSYDPHGLARRFKVPQRWVPNLSSLAVTALVLPRHPFSDLRFLSFALDPQTDARDLWRIVPRLEILTVREISSDSLFPEGPAPGSLRSIILNAAHWYPVDYSALIASWRLSAPGHQLQVQPSRTLQPFVELFTRSHKDLWEMSVGLVLDSVSLTTQTGVSYDVLLRNSELAVDDFTTAIVPLAPFLSRLSSLNIYGRHMAALVDMSLNLPALAELTVTLGDDPLPRLHDFHGVLAVSKFSRLHLAFYSLNKDEWNAMDVVAAWLGDVLPAIMRTYVSRAAALLEELAISGPDVSLLPAPVVAALKSLTLQYITHDVSPHQYGTNDGFEAGITLRGDTD